MIAVVAAILIQAPVQDPDVATWVKKLGDDSIEARDEAVRKLIEKGPGILEPLKRAMEGVGDGEVRLRLVSIIEAIEKRAELAKVLGPVKRVTTDAKPRLLKEFLETLGQSVGVPISLDAIDPKRMVEIELKDAGWWQALDKVAKVADLTYSFARSRKEGLQLKVGPGTRAELPVTYVEQFRVGVAETKRLKFEAPGRLRDCALVTVSILHQPNLIPGDKHIDAEITSAVDAKGESALAEWADCLGNVALYGTVPGYAVYAWVRPEAAYPLTIAGHADIDFVTEIREVSLEVPAGRAEFKDVILAIENFTKTETEIRLTLSAHAKGDKPRVNGLVDQLATIEGANGEKAGSWAPGMSFRNKHSQWDFKFPLDVKGPRKLTFKWQTGFHRVTIPFRLEGVRLP